MWRFIIPPMVQRHGSFGAWLARRLGRSARFLNSSLRAFSSASCALTSRHVHQRSASPCAGANGPPLNRLDDRLGLGRGKGAMGQILAFPSRQRGVEPPVDEVADLYESNLVAHVVGYLQRVEDRVGSAVVERLAVRLMVAMCYQLGDRVVDELINELEAMQHA